MEINGKTIKLAERKTFKYVGIRKPESIMQLVGIDFELRWVVAGMENKIHEARLKDPKRDFTEAELKVRILNDYRFMILEVIEENRVLNGLLFKTTKSFHIMEEKITKQAEEIESLKKQLKF